MKKDNDTIRVSSESKLQLPLANLIGIIIVVSGAVFGYANLTSRISSLETADTLFAADLLKKSQQLPTDQEQFMLLEHISSQVESIQKEMELMRNNNVNIKYAMSDIEKIKEQLEIIKDKVRANGGH
jgi:hypothetical protein